MVGARGEANLLTSAQSNHRAIRLRSDWDYRRLRYLRDHSNGLHHIHSFLFDDPHDVATPSIPPIGILLLMMFNNIGSMTDQTDQA